MQVSDGKSDIRTWQQFASAVRAKGCGLLRKLDEFPSSVLVTGCQRSGTTMLSRVITQSDGMVNYWFGQDDELDAALILSGQVEHVPLGRYCFQTTYLNECYREYFDHPGGHKILWVLRNPYSVVYSMLYHWKPFPLEELFATCGASVMHGTDRWLHRLLGKWTISRLHRACWSYNGKVSQLFELEKRLDDRTLRIVDYDDLVGRREAVLPRIYEFIGLEYHREYADKISSDSLNKAAALSPAEVARVKALCEPVYGRAKRLVTQL